jgi:hypothetical protein
MYSKRNMFPPQLCLSGAMSMLYLPQPALYGDHGLYGRPHPGNSSDNSDDDLSHLSVAFGAVPARRSWPLQMRHPFVCQWFLQATW